MKNNLTSKDFSLGEPDAWVREEQESLPRNFLRTEPFATIANSDKTFLCGRRGSGKSAIAQMLSLGTTWKYTETVQGERNQYGAYLDVVGSLAVARDSGSRVDIKDSVSSLWRWLIPTKVMQTIVTRAAKAGEAPGADVQCMQGYLDSLPGDLDVESSPGTMLSQIFLRAVEKLEDGKQPQQLAKFSNYLTKISDNRPFRAAVAALENYTRSSRVLVVFDTLESYKIFQAEMVEGLQGVTSSILSFLADRRMRNISLKFFIPAEIYERVTADLPGKCMPHSVFLRWRSQDLIVMLARRYLNILTRTEALQGREIDRLEQMVRQAYAGHDGRDIRRDFWHKEKFLPELVRNRRGQHEHCFAYMFRHTQRRPRDIIQQMQCIVHEARSRGEFPHISSESVVAGVHNENLLAQIIGDALSPYEGRVPDEALRRAKTMFAKRPVLMSGRKLKHFAQELYGVYPLSSVYPEDFVEMLLRCGVVGVVEDREIDSTQPPLYCKAMFEYLMQGYLTLADRIEYAVHPAMADAFGMYPAEECGMIYPIPTPLPGADTWLERELGIREAQ